MHITSGTCYWINLWYQEEITRGGTRNNGISYDRIRYEQCTQESNEQESSTLWEAIMGSSLWRSEIAVAYNSFYLPSLGYGMCATTLSFQECEDIQHPVINAILPKMGIGRKAARGVVFGTAQFGGPGLDHLATLQWHSRRQYLLGHVQCGDHTGQLVRMLIEYTQLECGTIENILKQYYDRFSNCIIKKKWIIEIWQHLHSCKATVAVQQKWKPRVGRINDTVIVDCITASNQFSRGELQDINRCHIYMRAFFISYIINIQGTLIEPWALSGNRQTTRTPAWAWPVQQRPTIWRVRKDTLEFLALERMVTQALAHGSRIIIKHKNGTKMPRIKQIIIM
jgi:hypothetical protein